MASASPVCDGRAGTVKAWPRFQWLTLVMFVLLVIAALAVGAWRKQAIPLRPMLPVEFDHALHASVQCAECHHNFVDNTGGGLCYDCHKNTPEIQSHIGPMFHDLCRGCHVQNRLQGEEGGPVRRCGFCHTSD